MGRPKLLDTQANQPVNNGTCGECGQPVKGGHNKRTCGRSAKTLQSYEAPDKTKSMQSSLTDNKTYVPDSTISSVRLPNMDKLNIERSDEKQTEQSTPIAAADSSDEAQENLRQEEDENVFGQQGERCKMCSKRIRSSIEEHKKSPLCMQCVRCDECREEARKDFHWNGPCSHKPEPVFSQPRKNSANEREHALNDAVKRSASQRLPLSHAICSFNHPECTMFLHPQHVGKPTPAGGGGGEPKTDVYLKILHCSQERVFEVEERKGTVKSANSFFLESHMKPERLQQILNSLTPEGQKDLRQNIKDLHGKLQALGEEGNYELGIGLLTNRPLSVPVSTGLNEELADVILAGASKNQSFLSANQKDSTVGGHQIANSGIANCLYLYSSNFDELNDEEKMYDFINNSMAISEHNYHICIFLQKTNDSRRSPIFSRDAQGNVTDIWGVI